MVARRPAPAMGFPPLFPFLGWVVKSSRDLATIFILNTSLLRIGGSCKPWYLVCWGCGTWREACQPEACEAGMRPHRVWVGLYRFGIRVDGCQ